MNEPARDVPEHVPAMLSEVMQLLEPGPGEIIVDATVGCAGHAKAIRQRLGGTGLLLGLDRDPGMAERARERLRSDSDASAKIVCANFSELDTVLKAEAEGRADGILADLGFASPQVDEAERGFSYRMDGPLDMRMNGEGDLTAEEWVNTAPEKEVADIIYQYGEERFSRRIARAIVWARDAGRITRTTQLAEIIRRAVRKGPRRLHPARRAFQAIRIHVNREMEHIERFLEILPDLLNPGGRCVMISYHSLEDRRVKNAFLAGAQSGLYERLTRKPLRPTPEEIKRNPRSRSAKVRAVRRTSGGGDS